MVAVLGRCVILAALFCPPGMADAAVNCDPLSKLVLPDATRRVIAYTGASLAGVSAARWQKAEREVSNSILSDYMRSLGLEAASIMSLELVVCEHAKTDSTLSTNNDAAALMGYGVTVAVWKSEDDGKHAVGHVVIPRVDKERPGKLSKLHAMSVDTVLGDPPDTWVARIKADGPALTALIGMSLGQNFLDRKEAAAAQLVLCKSRADLKLSAGRWLPAEGVEAELKGVLESMINQAETMASSLPAPTPQLQARIRAACTA